MNTKVTLHGGVQQFGWNEIYYNRNTTGNFGDAIDDALELVTLRRGFLDDDYAMDAVSVEECDSAGDTFLTSRTFIGYEGDGCGPGLLTVTQCPPPWLAYIMRLGTTDWQYRRELTMRGMPATPAVDWCANPVATPFPQQVQTPLPRFLDFITGSGEGLAQKPNGAWAIRATDIVAGKAVAVPITALAPLGVDDNRIVITAPGFTVKQGQALHIHGVKGHGLAGVNGNTTAHVNTTGNTTTLNKRFAQNCTQEYKGGGIVWLVNKILVPQVNVVLQRMTKKNTGPRQFVTKAKKSIAPAYKVNI